MAEIILPEIYDNLKLRFEAGHDKFGPDECWPWTRRVDRKGYGLLSCITNGIRRKRTVFATHVALELDGRHRQPGQVACHSCDNPACCNPRHLRWDTIGGNNRDIAIRARRAGERHHGAKLTEQQVLAIRCDPRTIAATSRAYGVAYMTVSFIRKRITWRHI